MIEDGREIIVLSHNGRIRSEDCLIHVSYAPNLSIHYGGNYCIECGKCGAEKDVAIDEVILTKRTGNKELGNLTLVVVARVVYNRSVPPECVEAG